VYIWVGKRVYIYNKRFVYFWSVNVYIWVGKRVYMGR